MESQTKSAPSFKDELLRLMPSRSVQIAWAVFGAAFFAFYWSDFQHLWNTWSNKEDYQHGFFVPIFSLALLYMRRDMIPRSTGVGNLWCIPFFIVWAVMRWTSVYFNYGTLPELSMLPFLAGAAVLVGGWQGLHWTWPSIFFLFFMIPLPGQIQGLASEHLQRGATYLSNYTIQTLGIPAVSQGNVIQLTDRPLEVARACSGLRMMMLFFALCIGTAFVSDRPLWEKLLIIASAAPIAIASNVVRIVLTAVLYEIASQWPSLINLDTAAEVIHNWAGYLMMPVGLLLLLAETTLLSKLMIEPSERALVMESAFATKGAATTDRLFQARRR